jgi:hypothetical protein
MKKRTGASPASKPAPAVAAGQVWKVGDLCVAVVSVGKTLIHFKRFKNHPRGIQTQLSSKPSFESYLRDSEAILLTE